MASVPDGFEETSVGPPEMTAAEKQAAVIDRLQDVERNRQKELDAERAKIEEQKEAREAAAAEVGAAAAPAPAPAAAAAADTEDQGEPAAAVTGPEDPVAATDISEAEEVEDFEFVEEEYSDEDFDIGSEKSEEHFVLPGMEDDAPPAAAAAADTAADTPAAAAADDAVKPEAAAPAAAQLPAETGGEEATALSDGGPSGSSGVRHPGLKLNISP